MKALILTLTLSIVGLSSGAYALIHGIEDAVSTATLSTTTQAQSAQVAQIVAML